MHFNIAQLKIRYDIGTVIIYIWKRVRNRCRKGRTILIQLFVSVLLYFVMFFGIAFILNMLLRKTWLMAIVYPFIVMVIISDHSFVQFFTGPKGAFSDVWSKTITLTIVDIIILSSGLIGTIVSGIVIKILRKSGYQMF